MPLLHPAPSLFRHGTCVIAIAGALERPGSESQKLAQNLGFIWHVVGEIDSNVTCVVSTETECRKEPKSDRIKNALRLNIPIVAEAFLSDCEQIQGFAFLQPHLIRPSAASSPLQKIANQKELAMFNLRVEVNIMRDLDTLQREHRESMTPQTLARFQHHHQLLAELIEWNDHNIEGPSKGAPKREPKQLRDGQKIGATIIPFGTVAAAASAAAASADCSPSTIVVDREADCPRSEAARDASSQVELYVLKVPASLVSLIGPAFKTENRTKLSRGQQDLLVLLIIATDQLFKRDEINSSSALGHARDIQISNGDLGNSTDRMVVPVRDSDRAPFSTGICGSNRATESAIEITKTTCEALCKGTEKVVRDRAAFDTVMGNVIATLEFMAAQLRAQEENAIGSVDSAGKIDYMHQRSGCLPGWLESTLDDLQQFLHHQCPTCNENAAIPSTSQDNLQCTLCFKDHTAGCADVESCSSCQKSICITCSSDSSYVTFFFFFTAVLHF